MVKVGKSLVLLLLLFPLLSFADVKVQALVDRNQLAMGGTFTLQVKVSSDQAVPVNGPSLPVIKGVQLLNKWVSNQTQSSVVSTPQGMDFKTVQTKLFNYQFAASTKGEIKIEPVQVDVGGKSYSTKPIKLNVVEAGQLARSAPPTGSIRQPTRPRLPQNPIDSVEEKFNQLLQRHFGRGSPGRVAPGGGPGGYMTEPRNAKEAFFILAEVDKTEAYKGEQVLASWYLYTTGRVRDIDTLKYPTLKGFWKEDIQIATHLNYEQDVINGVAYNRALLASYALFPIDEGKSKVDSYRAKATIIGGYGFGKGFSATKSSEEIPILIKPLPSDGRPNDYTGAVGEFQMKVEVADKSVVAHQPFALRIRFEGKGNAKLIELPQLPIGENLEIYDIKNESKFFKNGQSFKEFEVLLIPREPGVLTIPGLKNSFFDPKLEKYVLIESEEIQLKVLPGKKQISIGEERLKAKQKSLPAAIGQWDPNFKPKPARNKLWAIAFVLMALILILKAMVEMGVFQRNPDLKDLVKARFSKIEKMIAHEKFRDTGVEVTNVAYLVLGDISGEGGASEELNKLLAKVAPSVRREIEAPLRKLMEYFGILGFGPKSFVEKMKDVKELKSKTKEMEKLLFKAISMKRGDKSED